MPRERRHPSMAARGRLFARVKDDRRAEATLIAIVGLKRGASLTNVPDPPETAILPAQSPRLILSLE
jgi:hypothetical protein